MQMTKAQFDAICKHRFRSRNRVLNLLSEYDACVWIENRFSHLFTQQDWQRVANYKVYLIAQIQKYARLAEKEMRSVEVKQESICQAASAVIDAAPIIGAPIASCIIVGGIYLVHTVLKHAWLLLFQ